MAPATFPDAGGGPVAGGVVPFCADDVPVARFVLDLDKVLDVLVRVIVWTFEIVDVPVTVNVASESISDRLASTTPTKAETRGLLAYVPVEACVRPDVVLVTSPVSYKVLVMVIVDNSIDLELNTWPNGNAPSPSALR